MLGVVGGKQVESEPLLPEEVNGKMVYGKMVYGKMVYGKMVYGNA